MINAAGSFVDIADVALLIVNVTAHKKQLHGFNVLKYVWSETLRRLISHVIGGKIVGTGDFKTCIN